MGLLKDWRDHAYGLDERTPEGQKFWKDYFTVEKGIYEELLTDPTVKTEGTVKSLAERWNTDIETMTGFLDGINDSLVNPNDLDNMEEETPLTLEIDTEKLYMNMVQCNAEWLYTLPQWDSIYTKEKREELYKKEKSSHTIVKPPKVGRNDPCPCGSGKKYKKCCGANL
ncbi:MAG: SEC-C domain-containing protein [Eubacterium sp.]|nr:SEC-C domain-containing protein [Eubacterium sp.]